MGVSLQQLNSLELQCPPLLNPSLLWLCRVSRRKSEGVLGCHGTCNGHTPMLLPDCMSWLHYSLYLQIFCSPTVPNYNLLRQFSLVYVESDDGQICLSSLSLLLPVPWERHECVAFICPTGSEEILMEWNSDWVKCSFPVLALQVAAILLYVAWINLDALDYRAGTPLWKLMVTFNLKRFGGDKSLVWKFNLIITPEPHNFYVKKKKKM